MLMTNYAEGMVSEPGRPAQNVGYSKEWLDMTNYRRGPTKYDKPSETSK